ncbi:MAG: hypothetical protein H5T74_00535 [Actinobacteria bacterium]|nr:hypothetical protein [Actinomycetota bacterium]
MKGGVCGTSPGVSPLSRMELRDMDINDVFWAVIFLGIAMLAGRFVLLRI